MNRNTAILIGGVALVGFILQSAAFGNVVMPQEDKPVQVVVTRNTPDKTEPTVISDPVTPTLAPTPEPTLAPLSTKSKKVKKPKPVATKPKKVKVKKPKRVYYANCSQAPGPLYKGDPGYRSGLDRDGDVVACE